MVEKWVDEGHNRDAKCKMINCQEEGENLAKVKKTLREGEDMAKFNLFAYRISLEKVNVRLLHDGN